MLFRDIRFRTGSWTVVAAACACWATIAAADDRPLAIPHVTQLVLVIVPDWQATSGRLATFAKAPDGGWRTAAPGHPVTIGRSGCGWGLGLHPAEPVAGDGPRKREGDGRSPAGIFAIGPAFGAAATLDTGLEYRGMTAHDWCIDVPASPLYNRIVDDRDVGRHAVAGSTEPMRRDIHLAGDQAYALGFVIGHNRDRVPNAGSCIFAHPWTDASTPTLGCTAMADDELRRLLAWLRADAEPRFVLLPAAEHARRARDWGLPAMPLEGDR